MIMKELTKEDMDFIGTYGHFVAKKISEQMKENGNDPLYLLGDARFDAMMAKIGSSIWFARDMVAANEMVPPMLEIMDGEGQMMVVFLTDALSHDASVRRKAIRSIIEIH